MSEFLNYFNDHFIMYVLGISLIFILFFVSRINKKDRLTLGLIVVATLALATCEFAESLFDSDHVSYHNFPRYLFSVLAYVLRPIIIVLFFHVRFDIKYKRQYVIWLGVVINTIMYIFVLLAYEYESFRFVVWFSDKNTFIRSNLGYTVHVVCAVYLALLVVLSIIETRRNNGRKQIDVIILAAALMAVIAQGLSMILDLKSSHTSEVYVLGALLYFIYLSYDRSRNEAITHERLMQEKTTALMLSQIQPHFIYNTLATIQVLCEIDPEKAAETIDNFSRYLRINTDALSKTEPVLVIEEVNHAIAYSKIEMIRFENIKVVFDIQDKDFRLPVLTIQPIVENAIKYGVRARKKGLVEVKTYKDGNNHILVIKDNGVGFDENKIVDDGKNHVGVNNVKTRIVNMVNGTFDVKSEINKGTTVTITVPEESL